MHKLIYAPGQVFVHRESDLVSLLVVLDNGAPATLLPAQLATDKGHRLPPPPSALRTLRQQYAARPPAARHLQGARA